MRIFTTLKLIIRSLKKNMAISLLNVLGLTIGLTVSALIFLFVIKENSTDKFIPNLDRIYCITSHNETYLSHKEINLIKEELPDVDKITYCSVDWSPQIFLKRGEDKFKVEKMMTADTCFFRVFQFQTVWGNPQTALNTSNKLVITKSLSNKIFGNENPVGKTVVYNATYLQDEVVEIGAVIEDFPEESSWYFDAMLSFQTNYKIPWYVNNMKHWGTCNYKAFARTDNGVTEAAFLNKLAHISTDKVPQKQRALSFGLVPFSKVYFDLPELTFLKHGNKLTLSIIGVSGVLIFLLACINYINMTTAQRGKRAKNIGIIKTLGGSSKKVVGLVMFEAIIQVSLALIVSLLVITSLLPLFNELTSSTYELGDILSLKHVLWLMAIFLGMIAITGLIPGVIFSKVHSFSLIKKATNARWTSLSRNGLLVFQFTVTIALLSSVLIINKQSNYMLGKSPGFDKEGIIYASTNSDIYNQIDVFKDQIQALPGVAEITFSESPFINNDQNWGRKLIHQGDERDIHFSKLSVSPNFFQFFGIGLLEGRIFNKNSNSKQEFIFNQVAKKQFGIEELAATKMEYSEPDKGQVVGIIEDYNFESLHVPIRAAGYQCSRECDEVIYLKLKPLQHKQTIQQITAIWNNLSPDFPMEYHFVDDKWNTFYKAERQFKSIVSYTTIISILLSCLGLIGLTFYVIEQRTKEIGIRKVNGAKVYEVLNLLNKDFIKWVAIAFLIACPIAWYAMHKWLENFAYKASLSWWIFALAGLLALGIALLTVSWQSWRAATRNPVEALRYE